MYIFRTEVLSNYRNSNKILEFLEYGENNPHQLKKCDGSLSLYYTCKGIKSLDGRIAKYGERPKFYQCSYLYAKRIMRKTIRRIKEWEKNRI